MKHDEFIAKVRDRARLASNLEAERAIKATLETLAERLGSNEAKDLAAQLPDELAMYMAPPFAGREERFSLDEFFQRVSEREGVAIVDADYHSRVVIGLLAESVTMGEIEDIRAQLPADFAKLFEVENEGEIPELGNIADEEEE
ncbi:MAG: DUF2267 domain-containing protein [Chloroflexi bacterium]|nr:DUF2267 domain-containing protein [Chloroflexota bacterium]